MRYFDAEERRAGVPKDVAVLVDKMSDTLVRVRVVNLNPLKPRTLVIQGGAYGEHQLVAATYNDKRMRIDDTSFSIMLEPGAGTVLAIEMNRYANTPTMDFPWRR